MARVLFQRCAVRLRGLSALVAALVACGTAQGQDVCYQWTANSGTSGWFDSPQAAIDGHAAYCNAGNQAVAGCTIAPQCSATDITVGGRVCVYSADTLNTSVFPATFTWRASYSGGGQAPGTLATLNRPLSRRENPTGCPELECTAEKPRWWLMIGETRGDFPEFACDGSTGCMSQLKSLSCVVPPCVGSYVTGSENCTESVPREPEEGEVCSGEFCTSQANEHNCGFLNDEFVCLGSVPVDGCTVLGDGGRVCGEEAPMPPVPDAGTAGVPATPDLVIEVNDSTVNYYNSTTVSNSVRNPGTSGENPYSPGGGEGDGDSGGGGDGLMCSEEDGECDGSGEGHEEDITSGWDCWVARGEGEADETYLGKLGVCFQNAWLAMAETIEEESAIVALVVNTAEAWPSSAGGCPSATFEVWEMGGDLFAAPCALLEEHGPTLSILFRLMWLLIGMRILLSIPGGE